MNRSTLIIALLLTLCTPLAAQADTMPELVEKGRANIGFNTAFNFTKTTNQLANDDTATNSTLFLLATPNFGYFLLDSVELTLQTGLLLRPLQRPDGTRNNEMAGLLDVGANLHLPVSEVLAIIPGVGIGAYRGRSARPVTVTDGMGKVTTIDETTRTFGLDAYGQLYIGYVAGMRTKLYAGLTLHYLYGTERTSESGSGLSVSTLNTSIGTGLSYTF